jgi:hypothetical protein
MRRLHQDIPDTFKIFLINGELVPTWNMPLNRKKSAERHGITINGKNYIKVRFEVLKEWFHEQIVSVKDRGVWKSLTVYQYNRCSQRFREFNRFCSSVMAIDGSKEASNELLYREILEPFVDYFIEVLEL